MSAPHLVAVLALALLVIAVAARLFGAIARGLGQPPVIGEMAAGILLGPSLANGAVTRAFFPSDIRPALSLLSTVGVGLFMFLVGLHLDPKLLRGQTRIVTAVSVSAMAIPFGLGTLLALWLVTDHPTQNRLAFVLFIGTAMSITAFPVLARILHDRSLLRTPIGGLALACAATGDVLAWALLSFVAALAGGSTGLGRAALVIPYVAILLGVVRPLLARLAARVTLTGRVSQVAVVLALGGGLWLSAAATQWFGLHVIFGAFLFGVAMPREGGRTLRTHVLPWVDKAGTYILFPVFFVVAGLSVDLADLNGAGLAELGLILLVAVGGKFAGGFIAARLSGVHTRHSVVLAVLVNARGLTELVVITVGLQLGVLDKRLFSLMVVMALVTTALTGVLLRVVYPEERARRDMRVAAERADRVDADAGRARRALPADRGGRADVVAVHDAEESGDGFGGLRRAG